MTQSWRLLRVDEETPDELALSPVLAEAIAEAVARREQPPTLLLRRQRPHVLLGPADLRLPEFPRGLQWLEQQGLPVFVRVSGGSAVVLDDGCLSFAAIIPCRDLTALRRNYEELAAGVIDALSEFHMQAEFKEIHGVYCPGPYDLAVGGRKIVGISQALRRGYAEVGGMILVSQEPEPIVRILEGFYRAAGVPRRYEPVRLTNLQRETGTEVPLREIEAAIVRAYGRRFALQPGFLTPAERNRAEELLSLRRLSP